MLLKISNKSIGFDKEFSFLKDLFNNKVFPKAIMIKGVSGIGKYTFCLNIVSSLTNQTASSVEESLSKDNNILLDRETLRTIMMKFIFLTGIKRLDSFSYDELRGMIQKKINSL